MSLFSRLKTYFYSGTVISILLIALNAIAQDQSVIRRVCEQLLLPFENGTNSISLGNGIIRRVSSQGSSKHFYRAEVESAYIDFSISDSDQTSVFINYMYNPVRFSGRMTQIIGAIREEFPNIRRVESALEEDNYAVFSSEFHRNNEVFEMVCTGGSCSSDVEDAISKTPFYKAFSRNGFSSIVDFRFDPEDHYLRVVLEIPGNQNRSKNSKKATEIR